MPPLKRRKLNSQTERKEVTAEKRIRVAPASVENDNPSEEAHTLSASDAEPSVDEIEEQPQTGTEKSAPKTFKDLGVIEELCDACERLGYEIPTPIQSEAIPVALEGKDLIGLAETGSITRL